jgi:L-fuconolactonase
LAELLAVARSSLASLPQADRDWIFAKTAQTLYPALAD